MFIKEASIMIDWGSVLGRLRMMYIRNVEKSTSTSFLKIKSQVAVGFKSKSSLCIHYSAFF